jgi:hypothetical protein
MRNVRNRPSKIPPPLERVPHRFGSSLRRLLPTIPIRPEKVAKATYDQMEDQRYWHTAHFVRWQPERDRQSCTFDLLEVPLNVPALATGPMLSALRDRPTHLQLFHDGIGGEEIYQLRADNPPNLRKIGYC